MGSYVKNCGPAATLFFGLALKTQNYKCSTGPSNEQYHNQIYPVVSDLKIFEISANQNILLVPGNHVEFPINTNQNFSLNEVPLNEHSY
jgi:hypothetical protein